MSMLERLIIRHRTDDTTGIWHRSEMLERFLINGKEVAMTKFGDHILDAGIPQCSVCEQPMLETKGPGDGPRPGENVLICLQCKTFRYEIYGEVYELPENVELKIEFPGGKRGGTN